MKTSKIINKTGLLFTVIIMIGIYASGQESYIKHRWNIKAGYACYKTGSYIGNKEETTGNYRIEANYGFFKYIETGAYFGGSRFEYYQPVDSMSFIPKGYFVPFYGVNCNFHLLPFVINKGDFRFDLYIIFKYGSLVLKDKRSGELFNKNEYALGSGVCFYLWKHIGFYTEICYGNYIYENTFSNNHTKFRYGLSLKF